MGSCGGTCKWEWLPGVCVNLGTVCSLGVFGSEGGVGDVVVPWELAVGHVRGKLVVVNLVSRLSSVSLCLGPSGTKLSLTPSVGI